MQASRSVTASGRAEQISRVDSADPGRVDRGRAEPECAPNAVTPTVVKVLNGLVFRAVLVR
jgi:hypothetical protein